MKAQVIISHQFITLSTRCTFTRILPALVAALIVMKFGQRIKSVSERTAVREHQHAYVPYRALKKLIQQAPTEEEFAALRKASARKLAEMRLQTKEAERRRKQLSREAAPAEAIKGAGPSERCGQVVCRDY